MNIPPADIMSTRKKASGYFANVFLIIASAGIAGCSFGGGDELDTSVVPDKVLSNSILFDPEKYPGDQWRHIQLSGQTTYERVEYDDEPALRAVAEGTSSVLIRRVRFDPRQCRYLEIKWSAEEVQESANLHEKSGDDVAGSVFVAFGDPGTLLNPTPVPVLRYVWTNELHSTEVVIDSPNTQGYVIQGYVKNIVLRAGDDDDWQKDTRDLLADFRKAFGRDPIDIVHGIALMTDNDQTREDVEFHYGQIRSLCTG